MAIIVNILSTLSFRFTYSDLDSNKSSFKYFPNFARLYLNKKFDRLTLKLVIKHLHLLYLICSFVCLTLFQVLVAAYLETAKVPTV